MERQGVAAETIFQETGWYTGADGKWRFEIDDSGAQYNPRNQEGDVPGETLADYLQHDELFQNYPQLRKTRLRFENLGRGIQGSYTRSTDTITLDNSLRDAPEDVLVHEIQHAIQQGQMSSSGAARLKEAMMPEPEPRAAMHSACGESLTASEIRIRNFSRT